MQYEVPAQVQDEHSIQNHVHVVGGTNWDLSRSAITTPLSPYVAPTPQGYTPAHQVPSAYAEEVISFEANSALISPSALKQISAIPAKSTVVVAGHSALGEKDISSLSQRRADAVATQLKRRGHKVVEVKSFGVEVPKTYEEDKSGLNQRVDIFIQ